MRRVKRTAVIVKPKQPYIDWPNSLEAFLWSLVAKLRKEEVGNDNDGCFPPLNKFVS